MVVLDAQIVIQALPSIERALPFPVGGAQWVLSAYLLSFGGLLLLGGRMADLGRRHVPRHRRHGAFVTLVLLRRSGRERGQGVCVTSSGSPPACTRL